MERLSKTQQLQFLQSLKDSGSLDILLSELQEVPTSSMAAMHDGAKRRMFSPTASSEEFDFVDAGASDVAKKPSQIPVLPKASMAAGYPKQVPNQLRDMGEWGRTLNELPKYRSKNWCYSEMVLLATSDVQVRDYLGWVTRNPHVSVRVADFANYLKAIEWSSGEDENPIYFPGTCDIRRLK